MTTTMKNKVEAKWADAVPNTSGSPIRPVPPLFPTPPIPYHSYSVGAQYRTHAPKHGRLPENIPVDEARAYIGPDSTHATVHFCRNKCDNGRENIRVSIGSELSVDLTFDEFTEAFMAVVPRWFWKAKDERA